MVNKWKLRATGIGLLILGGVLFVAAVRDMDSGWPQIFVGLLSVFTAALGFGLLLMPLDKSGPEEKSNDDLPPS